MSVALYIAAGILMFGAMATAGFLALPAAALTGIGLGLFFLCAWAFLASVHKSKKFLTEHGLNTLPDFGVTVIWFAVPFANFYIPWRRLATIRNSLSHYLKTGELEEHEGGRGATIILAVLYFANSISDRLATAAPETADVPEELWVLALVLWLTSFLYSSVWLASLARKRAKAEKRLKTDPSIAEVFA